MNCPECGSDNVIPSFTIPTWKCLNCGHISPAREPCCMNCRYRGMQFCPFHKGYTGWDDIHCNKWEEVQSSTSTARDEK